MLDPMLAQHYDATRGVVAPLAFSALPDAPVVRTAQVAPRAWRLALAAALRRAATRLDRPAVVPAHPC